MTDRPTSREYAPFYQAYVERVPEGEIVQILARQLSETTSFLRSIEARASYRYAEGKWSVKEVVGHLIDAERIFTYRALRIARSDETALPGYDENAYMRMARFSMRDYHDLIDELNAVRQSNLFFYRTLNEAEWTRTGIADGKPVSVRALAYISSGHELHHLHILKTRYLNNDNEPVQMQR